MPVGTRRDRGQPNQIVLPEKPTTRATRRIGLQNRNPCHEKVLIEAKEEILLLEGVGKVGEIKEEIGEIKMNEFDSGARSADKIPIAEEEGTTAPLPEKVSAYSF